MSNFDATRVMSAPGAGATMQMPAGADPRRTQMGGTTTCPVCQSTTPILDRYCGDCGFMLNAAPPEELVIPSQDIALAELVDSQTGRRFKLKQGVNTLGRQSTDILISDGTISRNHARITFDNNAFTVEDLGSSNGTKVGETRLLPNQPVAAAPGDKLRFGNWYAVIEQDGIAQAGMLNMPSLEMPAEDRTVVGSFPIEEAESSNTRDSLSPIYVPPLNIPDSDIPPVEIESPSGPKVAVLKNQKGPIGSISVHMGTISIGRKPGNTIVIAQDGYLSGKHAEFFTDESGTFIIDLGSTNGTSVNGKKLNANERQQLVEGDEVQIGQTMFRFEPIAEDE